MIVSKKKLSFEEKVEFVEKMRRENPRAFNFLARGAVDLLNKIEQDKKEEEQNGTENDEQEQEANR